MIVFQTPERLKEVLPYLEGLLGKCAGILSLTLDEIKMRERIVKQTGGEVLMLSLGKQEKFLMRSIDI